MNIDKVKEAALYIAIKGTIILKNNNMLPLDLKSSIKVAIIRF